MLKIIENKKGQAVAGAIPNSGATKPKGGWLARRRARRRDGKLDAGELTGSLLMAGVAKKVMDGIGNRMAGRDKTISLENIIKGALWPVRIVLRFIQFHIKFFLQIAIALMIAGSVWIYGVPVITVTAAENDLRDGGDWMNYIAQDIIQVDKIKASVLKKQQQVDWKIRGQFIEPEEGEDDTKYGIYLTSRDVGSLKELYAPNEQIIVFAYPQAEVLSGEGYADIECTLEESMGPPKIHPSSRMPLYSLPGSSITCEFDPIAVNDDPQREATITIKYPFETSSTLPVSVMNKAEYDKLFKLMMLDEGMDVIGAKKEIAKSVKVDYNQKATVNENTPVVIGAKITEYQPLVRNAGYTASLLVTVTNQGEGTIQEIKSMRINAGDLGLKLNGIGIDINQYGIVDPEYLHSIGEINNFQSFLFGVETGAFQLDSNKDVTTSRITVYVDYIYNISATTDVNVASCRTFPSACAEEVADVEENEEGEV